MKRAVILILTACVAASQAQTVLRFKFKPGTTRRYRMSMKMSTTSPMSTTPMKIGMEATVVQTVKSVSSNGTATVASRTTTAGMTMNGKPYPMNSKKDQVVTMKITPTGTVSGMNTGGGMSMMSGSNMFQGMQFGTNLPSGPVHRGSSWNSVINSGTGGNMAFHNTLTKLASSGGQQLAYVHSSGVVDIGKITKAMKQQMQGVQVSGKLSLSLDWIFNATGGYIEKQNGHGTMTMDMKMNDKDVHMNGSQQMSLTLVH